MYGTHKVCVVVALLTSSVAWGAPGATASTVLKDKDGVVHSADLAFDGLMSTAWAEGDMGPGEGAWLEIALDRTTAIESVSLWPGDISRDERSLKENGRPKLITVELISRGEPVTMQAAVRDVATYGIQRIDVPIIGDADRVRIRIDEAFSGYLHNDTYITEVALNFAAGVTPAFDRLDAWVASDAGVKAATAHHDRVVGLFDTFMSAEFGDRDAMATLVSWAGDGAPYLRDRVKRDAPIGYRVQGLRPDSVAIDALLKIKDPNAIPGIQLAALRSRGKDARSLEATVSFFEAYAEFKGGGRRVIAPWGQQGWEKGAIHTFGEPPGIAVGAYGDLYVADTANHRVDVFGQDGRLRGMWGKGSPNISDVWFGGRRRHYVAGMEASTDAGGFTDPIALTVVPGRDPDEVLVLDALGRVSWMDAEGNAKLIFSTGAKPAEPGVGGSGHVLWVKGQIVVIVGSDGFVFDSQGQQKNTFTIEDGAPITAAVLKNGRLALGFHRGAIQYDLSGFRHAVLLTGDELPGGYESWSLALDEKGKLWVVTDRGDIVKFKRPGKPEFTLTFSKVGVSPPRFAVFEDMVYIATDGRVQKVDVLTAREDAAKAALELGE